jgi:hypothetical protein
LAIRPRQEVIGSPCTLAGCSTHSRCLRMCGRWRRSPLLAIVGTFACAGLVTARAVPGARADGGP